MNKIKNLDIRKLGTFYKKLNERILNKFLDEGVRITSGFKSESFKIEDQYLRFLFRKAFQSFEKNELIDLTKEDREKISKFIIKDIKDKEICKNEEILENFSKAFTTNEIAIDPLTKEEKLEFIEVSFPKVREDKIKAELQGGRQDIIAWAFGDLRVELGQNNLLRGLVANEYNELDGLKSSIEGKINEIIGSLKLDSRVVSSSQNTQAVSTLFKQIEVENSSGASSKDVEGSDQNLKQSISP